jgi:hypothetical protein
MGTKRRNIMPFYLSPLVDVNEISLDTTIQGVATSIGVIVLRDTYKGPELKKQLLTRELELEEVFGKITTDRDCYRDMLNAKGFLKYGSSLYATRVLPVAATFAGTKVTSAGTAWEAFSTPLTLADLDSADPDNLGDDVTADTALWVIASSRGAWGNNVRIATLTKTSQNEMVSGGNSLWATYPVFADIDSPLVEDTDFLVVVQEMPQGGASWITKEVHNVSTKELAIDDQGNSKFVENVINQQSAYIRVAMSAAQTEQNWTLDSESWVALTDGAFTASTVTEGTIMEALDLYANPEEIDVNILIDSDKPVAVKQYMIQIAESRKDCMAILDPPMELCVNNRGNEATDLRDWRRGLGAFTSDNLNENTSYASLYGNWAEIYEKDTKKYRWIPLSGNVAGMYANTDDVAEPWFAPAGLNRGVLTGIRKLAWNPTQGHRDILYKNGINPIVPFAGQGKVIWGQKTLLDKPSGFNRVNVRRLFMILEKAIATSSKYFLFEPNDPVTRTQLVNMIEPFLRDVQSRRGIRAFKVVCDESNNTSEREARNELWCSIIIQPTRSAEFIVLNFVSVKDASQFEEASQVA